MFMTYPMLAEVQMFSVTKYLQPTHIAVERASGYGLFAPSHQRPGDGAHRRSAFVVVWQFLTPASSSRGRLTWSPENHGQLCVWSKEHLEESYVFSVVIGVCVGLMSASVLMRRKRFRVRGS